MGDAAGAGETVIVSVPDPVVPETLLQVRSTMKVPTAVGLPLIWPLDELIESPGGKLLAPKVDAPSATTGNAKGYPTMPDAVELLMIGIFAMTGAESAA